MLKGIVLWLIKEGFHVTLAARDQKKMLDLAEESEKPNAYTFLPLDYSNTQDLEKNIVYAIEKNGPVTLAAVWVHSTAPEAVECVSSVFSNQQEEGAFFHVKSHTAVFSTRPQALKEHFSYHQIILGFIEEENRRRWLSHREIADGVIEAVKAEKQETIIGRLE